MLKNALKGMLIGLANIIPGVSGGTLAISMGIYDKLIHCVSHFFEDFMNNMLFIAPILLGMGIAIMGSAFGIDYLFEMFPVQTNFLFIGLILGSLPTMYGKVKITSIKVGYIISAVVFFVLVVGMALMKGATGNSVTIDTSFTQLVILFLIGILASATMVVPGVSGSMMLLLLGYYYPILDMIQECLLGVVNLEIGRVCNAFVELVPFGIGVVVGIILIAKLIEMVFKKIPMYAYWSIIGLLIASPIAILTVGDFPDITFFHAFTGICTFIAGWFISNKLGEKE